MWARGKSLVSDTIVFRGPSISKTEVIEHCPDAICMPPVSQGDILTTVSEYKPSTIVIIDGFFGAVPSVTHKEIIWALAQEVSVVGASSMGALRAAELQPFGMIGCGDIFEKYVDKHFEDDDEVALSHAPEELDFAPLSDPMVNIRATLEAAVEASVISSSISGRLISIIKSVHYKFRNYNLLIEFYSSLIKGSSFIDKFGDFLKDHAVDQKKIDAELALKSLPELVRRNPITAHDLFLPPSTLWLSVAHQYLNDEKLKMSLFEYQ